MNQFSVGDKVCRSPSGPYELLDVGKIIEIDPVRMRARVKWPSLVQPR